MRRIDKKLNLQKVNMLTEQRYLQSKGLLKENGPETDIEGVTNSLVSYFDEAISDKKNIEYIATKIQIEAKKTLDGHNANQETIEKFYNTLADKTEKLYKTVKNQNKQNYIRGQAIFYRQLADYYASEKAKQGGLSENDLATYRSEMQNTGDYPMKTFLGNKEKGDEEQTRNTAAAENFENKFKNKYNNQTINTTDGLYNFIKIKIYNNHGNYVLFFTKPKGVTDSSDKTLWISYDQTNGYYIDNNNNNNVKLTDEESEQKVIEMLSHNKE